MGRNPGRPSRPLSADLPPLILGTATFNSQYNADPYALPTTEIVHRALASGIRAFDTSPYYGPAEELLGRALATHHVRTNFPRHAYRLLTKVGRVGLSSFDYSPAWVRKSVQRSLARLETDYVDVVYCHDVEFVSAAEVLAAVRELRRIRDSSGAVRYVGISGYPVDVLCELAETVRRETGEPLDAVMSYANFTLQNTRLETHGLPRLLAAGVDVIPNASPLGMGLLRRDGVPVGSMGDFHPAPDGLRHAIRNASNWALHEHGEKLEVLAIRFALEAWLHVGAAAGAMAPPLANTNAPVGAHAAGVGAAGAVPVAARRLGVSVMGVSNTEELDETLRVWNTIAICDNCLARPLDLDHADEQDKHAATPLICQIGADLAVCAATADLAKTDPAAPSAPGTFFSSDSSCANSCSSSISSSSSELISHFSRIQQLARAISSIIGPEWTDYVWPSPGPDFINSLPPEHVAAMADETHST